MELRAYIRIVLRRWWLVVGLTAATALLSWLTSPLFQGNYQASLRVLLNLPAERALTPSTTYTYDRYYSYLSTEYLVDDLIEVTRSQAFRDAALKELSSPPAGPFRIESEPRRERAPRILTVTVTAASPAEAQRIGEAVARIIATQMGDYFGQAGLADPIARVIDPPTVASASTGGRNYLNIALRSLAGLLVGLGLAFLLHYLDTTLYDAEEATRQLGLPLLVVVPPYPEEMPRT